MLCMSYFAVSLINDFRIDAWRCGALNANDMIEQRGLPRYRYRALKVIH